MSSRQTRFSDVCGTMDEMKRLLHEEHERVASDPEGTILPLLADALYMIGRMKARSEEYLRFRDRISNILSHLDQLDHVDPQKACQAIESQSRSLKSQSLDVRELDALAESTRAVASAQEHELRAHKELTLKLHDEFVKIKGNRAWLMFADHAESPEKTMEKTYQAWLPPQPHRAELLKKLAASRAFVTTSEQPDGEPMVQFMDGGAMRMSQVRWEPAVKNFHPASFQPGATGREYRRTSPGDSS